MTRAELLERMSGEELREWELYNATFGLGDTVDLMGNVCTLIAQGLGNPDAAPADFSPYLRADKEGLAAQRSQSPEEMAAALERFCK